MTKSCSYNIIDLYNLKVFVSMKKYKKMAIKLTYSAAMFLLGSIIYQSAHGSFDPAENTRQIIQAVRTMLYTPYNLAQLYVLQNNPKSKAYKHAQHCIKSQPFPPAKQTFQELNSNPYDFFLMSIGTAMSQTNISENIIHPEHLAEMLEKESQANSNPKKWLADRNGYITRAKSQAIPFSDEDRQAFVQQLKTLGIFNQPAAKIMPAYRLSIEIADVVDKDGNIAQEKLQQQAQFLKDLGNPLTIFHHYINPKCKPNLFEDKNDIQWFANVCAEFIKACPDLTHVCPISQIMGFGMQVSRQKMLPPFSCSISTDEYLKNIVQAQVTASKAMKEIKPTIKVLVSHQWKPMKPVHSLGDPRHAIECTVCSIADRMYNQKFVQLLKPHTDSFDGIALSVYPAMYFDSITPQGNNCTGKLDPLAALEIIAEIHKAFPDKEIHIIETGCNSNDFEVKKQFVDMTLYVCKLARALDIPVKSCYFWGHTNNPYFEWNANPGTSFFGPFEDLSTQSINQYGLYLKEILS